MKSFAFPALPLVWIGCLFCFAVLGADTKLPSVVQTRDAAERGDVEALLTLGALHASKSEFPEAMACYRKAAQQGSIEGLVRMGHMYDTGKPRLPPREAIPKDRDLALKCFTQAAHEGHAGAQRELGLRYRSGTGVPKDVVEAYKWFKLAAAKDSVSGNVYLPDLARNLPREDVTEGERRAAEFKPGRRYEVGNLLLERVRLQAIAGSGSERVALINDQIVRVGEEVIISIMGESLQLKCIAIGDGAVTIATTDGRQRKLSLAGN